MKRRKVIVVKEGGGQEWECGGDRIYTQKQPVSVKGGDPKWVTA